eukprot:6460569-Amphidinium_carterae.2
MSRHLCRGAGKSAAHLPLQTRPESRVVFKSGELFFTPNHMRLGCGHLASELGVSSFIHGGLLSTHHLDDEASGGRARTSAPHLGPMCLMCHRSSHFSNHLHTVGVSAAAKEPLQCALQYQQ